MQMRIYRLTVLLSMLIGITLMINGCTSLSSDSTTYNNDHSTRHINLLDIKELKVMATQQTPTGTTVSKIRLQALKQTALSLGAQTGLAWRARKINVITNRYEKSLNRIFDFRRLMIDNDIMPPVLVEADKTLNLDNETTIRLSGTVYKIIQQAKFVTVPPNWRQYLILTFKYPDIPNQTLLPKNKEEDKIWRYYILTGWRQGVEQANNIYLNQIAKLTRDINGIMLYRTLLVQNIVSKPFVGKTNLGVTSNNDRSALYLNDQVLRITALPQLNPDTKTWQPITKIKNKNAN